MQQRVYRGGNATPDSLADFLVQQYAYNEHYAAQKLGTGNSVVVQIARRDRQNVSHAATIGITRSQQNETDMIVTLGEQQWIDSNMIGFVAMMGLISLLITPWALFALIWPAAHFLGQYLQPNEIWAHVDGFVIGQGAIVVADQILSHPHMPDAYNASAQAGYPMPYATPQTPHVPPTPPQPKIPDQPEGPIYPQSVWNESRPPAEN